MRYQPDCCYVYAHAQINRVNRLNIAFFNRIKNLTFSSNTEKFTTQLSQTNNSCYV